MKPSNFTRQPFGSIAKKSESETVASNIMRILKRTGDKWRLLEWTEYQHERRKDGNFSIDEKYHFEDVNHFCVSEQQAKKFCNDWGIEDEEIN